VKVVSLPESPHNGTAGKLKGSKMSDGVIAAQRYGEQPTVTVDNGMPIG
jgi:hypothetical protein